MLYAIVALIGLILDQAVKYWTTANLAVNTGYKEVIPGIIHLTNVHNTGAAFSFMSGARWLFVALCVVFVIVVIILLGKRVINTPVARWMCVLVLSGAIGNCIDRVISGYVVDMFEFSFKIFGMYFPVFNVADILITLGGIIFCLCILFEKDPEKVEAKKAMKEEKAQKASRRPKAEDFDIAAAQSVDTNEPFVKWDGEPIPEPAPAKKAAPAPAPAPAKRGAKPVKPAEPKAPVKTAPAAAPVEKQAAPAKKAAPAPVKEKAPTATKVYEAPVSESFDLDDILAEFRDL